MIDQIRDANFCIKGRVPIWMVGLQVEHKKQPQAQTKPYIATQTISSQCRSKESP